MIRATVRLPWRGLTCVKQSPPAKAGGRSAPIWGHGNGPEMKILNDGVNHLGSQLAQNTAYEPKNDNNFWLESALALGLTGVLQCCRVLAKMRAMPLVDALLREKPFRFTEIVT